MPEPAIRVENLSKLYRIGTRRNKADTLREKLTHAIAHPFRHLFGRNGRGGVESRESRVESQNQKSAISDQQSAINDSCDASTSQRLNASTSSDASTPQPLNDSTIWALRDVSFEVQPGEVVGIIGRNGAGKSTLLKILSRITEPTAGRVEIRGRVASLLEVGTGFHPELTGRENIYLNGNILGMTNREVARKFDEIVDFAEIEKFIDTPVKRYSSGMYTRLAFAVAAHLDPEILLLDEVLAVGDAAFQKKCLGKMGDVARQGRTILFVTHNLTSVNALCSRSALFESGLLIRDGRSTEVVSYYVTGGRNNDAEVRWPSLDKAPGNEKVRLHAVRVVCRGHTTADVSISEAVTIEIDFWNLKPGANLSASIHLLDKSGILVLCSGTSSTPLPCGLFRTTCTIPGNFLNDGRYSVNAILLTEVTNAEVWQEQVISFTVHESEVIRSEYLGHIGGVVRPHLPWTTVRLEPNSGHLAELLRAV